MAEADDLGEPRSTRAFIEPRWPIGLAVSAFLLLSVALRVLVPRRESIGPHWLLPGLECVVLIVLLVAHPSTVDGAQRLRRLSITLIGVLAFTAMVSTAALIFELITGSEVTESADSLLASGVIVYLGNALAFSLLYWQLDSGGPLARARRERTFPDFAFTQQLSPELAPPDWRPMYVDYFVLGFTTSTAFSPTDVMPLAPWAKLTMSVQSLISLAVVGLVIARAVNVFA